MSHAGAIDTDTICRALDAKAGELAHQLLPNGRRSSCRRWWETNSIDDCPRAGGGYSLKVELRGPHQGSWRDHATAERGDMLDLVAIRMFGGNKGDAFKYARSYLGFDNIDPGAVERVRYQARQRADRDDRSSAQQAEAKIRRARSLWLSGVPIAGTPAERYLQGRGLDFPVAGRAWPGSLMFHEEVWNRDAGVKLPCMLAMMVTPGGAHNATHRTWLGRDASRRWVKADAADLGVPKGEAKKVIGKSWGCFIPIAKGNSAKSMSQLAADAGERFTMSEGIEDALTLSLADPAVRIGAAYSLPNFGGIEFPPAVAELVFAIDRDKPKDDGKTPQLDALERAIARQQERGKRVTLAAPPAPFKDFNEWHVAMLAPREERAA